jgi:uncharacterized protein
MPKVVLDTNVLVSALIQRSYPFFIVDKLFLEGKIQLCISDELLKEYYEVLNRKKFSKYPDFVARAEILLADIETKASKYIPKTKVSLIKDLDDNKLLELAAESTAAFLVTGNTNDFTMTKFKKTRIVSPKEFWEAVA